LVSRLLVTPLLVSPLLVPLTLEQLPIVPTQTPDQRPLAAGYTHETDIPLRWGDSDVLNHLNNTLYFRLMEEARIQILYQAGMRLPASQGAILAHASCDFLRPLTYPALVRVRHTVTRVGRASLELHLQLDKVGDPDGPYATGRNVLVYMDYDANRSQPWPDETLAALAGVMRAPDA